MLYISELCEDCALANEIDYEIDDAWTNIHGIHDNGRVIKAVWLLTLTAYYKQVCLVTLHSHFPQVMGVFTWTRITFRKTFRNVIQNVIGIVIWTTCVYMGNKRLSNHDQELRTASDILLLLRSPCALIDPCAYAWLQRAFLKCTRTNHVPKQICVTWTRIRLSRRITIQNALFFAFENAFQKPDLKQLFVYMG